MKHLSLKVTKLLLWLVTSVSCLLLLIGCIGIVVNEPTLWQGLLALRNAFDPFNIANVVVYLLLFSPTLILLKVKKWLENKTESEHVVKKTEGKNPRLVEIGNQIAQGMVTNINTRTKLEK